MTKDAHILGVEDPKNSFIIERKLKSSWNFGRNVMNQNNEQNLEVKEIVILLRQVIQNMEEISQMLQTQLMYCERMKARFTICGNIGFTKSEVENAHPFRVVH